MARFFGIIMVLLSLVSCEKAEYKLADPITVTVNNVPAALFPADTMIYVLAEKYDILKREWVAIYRGNTPVDAGGTAEISLHTSTGVPANVNYTPDYDKYSESVSFYCYILESARGKRLYRAKQTVGISKGGETNVVYDFLSDFDEVP